MKRKIGCLLAAFLLLTVCLSGCGNTGMTEEIDETKTQLYVANYDGGVGEEWLRETADLFEEKYKDTEFEPGTGKRGVQIFIDTQEVYAGSGLSAIMRGSAYSIFFGEQLRYYDLASQGYVLDITDVVTESLQDISGENTTIEAKLSPARREALKVGGKYYGLPHYELYPGVTYDKDLFQTKALYIKEGGGYTNQASEMTVGPDGVRGSYDDGLPSSYEEFFALCAQMRRVGVTPFIWSGDYYHYFDNLLLGLFVNSASASEIEVNFTFNSGSDTVPIVTGFNGEEPIVEEKAVTPEMGYLMSQSYSKYMALDFGQRVFAGSYYDSNSTTGTFSHTEAQETYIYSAL